MVAKKSFSSLPFFLLCWALLLIRLPPLYIFLINSAFLSSYSIARYVLLGLFLNMIYVFFKEKKVLTINRAHIFFIAVYFLSQSISIINALNVAEFMSRYMTVVFGIISFVLVYVEVNTKERLRVILDVLLISIIGNITFQAIIYFQIPVLYSFYKSIANEKYLLDIEINMQRMKYFVDVYDAALIPIIFYILVKTNKNFVKMVLLCISFVVTIFTVVSNFRSQFVVLLVSTISAIMVLTRHFTRLIGILFLVIILFFAIQIVSTQSKINSIDRLVSPGIGDITTLTDRLYYWNTAIYIGSSYPLFGIGLGNFYDYIPKNIYPIIDKRNNPFKATWVHPHNVFIGHFVESGAFGLISFCVLLIFFIQKDFRILHTNSHVMQIVVASFWSLFLFSLINPAVTLNYTILFWTLRAIIANSDKYLLYSIDK